MTSSPGPGALPLLQFALTELFERASTPPSPPRPTPSSAASAAPWPAAPKTSTRPPRVGDRDDVHRLFTQLVTPGDDADDLRRRATLEELAGIDPTVIEAYRANRLIVTDHHPITREPTVEVAHEALLREWPRLAGLDRRRPRHHPGPPVPHPAAHDWHTTPDDDAALYRGTRLEAADQVAATVALTALETDFLAASHQLADREHAATQPAPPTKPARTGASAAPSPSPAPSSSSPSSPAPSPPTNPADRPGRRRRAPHKAKPSKPERLPLRSGRPRSGPATRQPHSDPPPRPLGTMRSPRRPPPSVPGTKRWPEHSPHRAPDC